MNEGRRQKENPDEHGNVVNDGSAARTRPTSVEEIRLRRKRKKSLETVIEGTVGVAQLLGNNIVEKASEYHESGKGYDRSKNFGPDERVEDSSRRKEDTISSSKEEKPVKEDPVGAAHLSGNVLVEKVPDYHESVKGYDRSKKLRHEELVKDSSTKKEEAISSSREERLDKSMKEDPVGAVQLLGNDLGGKVSDCHASEKGHDRSSKKVRREECVKDGSRKKEDTISRTRDEKQLKEDHVEAAHSMGKNLVEKVSDHRKSDKGYDRSKELRREECIKDSSRKKEETISSFREEKPDKPKKDDPAANRKRKAESSTAESKVVDEHGKDKRRNKKETYPSCGKERLDKKVKKEDLAANQKIEGEFPTTERKTMTERDGVGVDTKTKERKESFASKTTGKQIYPQKTDHERARSALELPGNRNRLRSLVVAEIPRDENNVKPENGNKRKNQNEDHKKNRERDKSKRHDPGKVNSVEVSERWGKKEQPKSHQHDMREKKGQPKSHLHDVREKRRRSRSRDHGQDRQRRSSPLARAEKATLHHERDHEERSEHSIKERTGKHRFNGNEKKAASTVNNKSKRYTASKSELGGYSPRKRREEASAKAASPPNLSSEKKSAKWDLAPTVTASIFSESVLSGPQAATQTAFPTITETSLTLLKPFMEAPFRKPLATQTTSLDSVQLTESTRRMRRLYAENVPDSASEKSLIDCINGYMLSSGSNHIKGTEPCISCIINKEKSQALVEFLTPQDATAALSLDGCSFAGSNLKLRRPKDYVETTSGELEKRDPATNALSDNVEDSLNKIFIGGFSKAISSEMLMEIVSVFGPLKAYRFVSNNNLRCAFLEYTDGSVTLKACAGLNGMKLGGSVLIAVCAFPDASSVPVNENPRPPFYGIPEHAKPLLGKPKHTLKLKNVVDPEDLLSLSEPEVKEILEDVRFECARFGVIKSMNIVERQSKDTTGSETNALVNLESIDSEEKIVSVIQQKDEGSNKADDIPDTVDPAEIVRLDISTGEDKLCEPCSDTAIETKAQENEDQHPTEQDHCENIVGETAHDETEIRQDKVGSTRAVKTRWDAGDKIEKEEEEEQNPENVFEPGCIFIEYGRPEATCDAAHSLHGRLYGNRIVKAEYVSKELYQIRFPSR